VKEAMINKLGIFLFLGTFGGCILSSEKDGAAYLKPVTWKEVQRSSLLFERGCDNLEENFIKKFEKKISESENLSENVVEEFRGKIEREKKITNVLEFHLRMQRAVDKFHEKYPRLPVPKRKKYEEYQEPRVREGVEAEDISLDTGWGHYWVSPTELMAWRLFYSPSLSDDEESSKQEDGLPSEEKVKEEVEETIRRKRRKLKESYDNVFE
jgi:hypothetical protein